MSLKRKQQAKHHYLNYKLYVLDRNLAFSQIIRTSYNPGDRYQVTPSPVSFVLKVVKWRSGTTQNSKVSFM